MEYECKNGLSKEHSRNVQRHQPKQKKQRKKIKRKKEKKTKENTQNTNKRCVKRQRAKARAEIYISN